MRRLHVRFFVALVLTALAATLSVHGMALWLSPGHEELERRADEVRALAEELLQPDDHPRMTRRKLRRYSRRLKLRLSLYGSNGHKVAGPGPDAAPNVSGAFEHGDHDAWAITLSDGRTLVLSKRRRHRAPPRLVVIPVAVLVFLLGSYLVARSVTRRLATLESAVEEWGVDQRGETSGAFKRTEVSGNDEVARLSRAFNNAADRIEALLAGQRRVLASASHELRTPMTRISVAVEMLRDAKSSERRNELVESIEADLAELDSTVGEILISARLQSPEAPELNELLLTALVAEECETASVEPTLEQNIVIRGNELLLRRLIRNLLQNAKRYGDGSPATVELRLHDGAAQLEVRDRGPGIDDGDRERIFEPFFRATSHREGQGGVGIGLYLARQITEQHGGRITYARDGGESVFRVTLPVADVS